MAEEKGSSVKVRKARKRQTVNEPPHSTTACPKEYSRGVLDKQSDAWLHKEAARRNVPEPRELVIQAIQAGYAEESSDISSVSAEASGRPGPVPSGEEHSHQRKVIGDDSAESGPGNYRESPIHLTDPLADSHNVSNHEPKSPIFLSDKDFETSVCATPRSFRKSFLNGDITPFDSDNRSDSDSVPYSVEAKKKKVIKMEETVAKLEGRIQKLKYEIDNGTARMQRHDHRMVELDTKFASHTTEMNDQRADFQRLHYKVEAHDREFEGHNGKIRELESQDEMLLDNVYGLSSATAKMKEDMGKIKRKMHDLRPIVRSGRANHNRQIETFMRDIWKLEDPAYVVKNHIIENGNKNAHECDCLAALRLWEEDEGQVPRTPSESYVYTRIYGFPIVQVKAIAEDSHTARQLFDMRGSFAIDRWLDEDEKLNLFNKVHDCIMNFIGQETDKSRFNGPPISKLVEQKDEVKAEFDRLKQLSERRREEDWTSSRIAASRGSVTSQIHRSSATPASPTFSGALLQQNPPRGSILAQSRQHRGDRGKKLEVHSMQLEELEREDEQLSNEIQGLRKVDAMINKELGETESKLQVLGPVIKSELLTQNRQMEIFKRDVPEDPNIKIIDRHIRDDDEGAHECDCLATAGCWYSVLGEKPRSEQEAWRYEGIFGFPIKKAMLIAEGSRKAKEILDLRGTIAINANLKESEKRPFFKIVHLAIVNFFFYEEESRVIGENNVRESLLMEGYYNVKKEFERLKELSSKRRDSEKASRNRAASEERMTYRPAVESDAQ